VTSFFALSLLFYLKLNDEMIFHAVSMRARRYQVVATCDQFIPPQNLSIALVVVLRAIIHNDGRH